MKDCFFRNSYLNFSEWRNGQMPCYTQQQPILHDLPKIPAAFLQCLSICPDTLQCGNFTIIRLFIIDDFIGSSIQSRLNIFQKHQHYLR